jgi:iron-sulfur cluster repair protein YtfE (RIC family)
MTSTRIPDAIETATPAGMTLEDRLIRDLVADYPETMTILGPLGIDLCCGGGHPLGETLDLHGFDRAAIVPRVASVVEASMSRVTRRSAQTEA